MSTVCQGFVQNTWKKDFCSNCFKSKDEHTNEKTSHKSSYFATPFQNKNTFLSKSPKSTTSNGILKLSPKKKHKRMVSFPQEVSKVIGYGGDIWSDDEEFQLSEDVEEDDYVPDCEEEKQLKQLTKSNTDFNTVKANLLANSGETKKSYTSLLLGRMQTDSEGKKKTLLVSVTPFGHESPSVKSSIAKLSDKKSPVPILHKNKASDYKTNIILTSFVKNCDTPLNNNFRKDSDSNIMASEKTLLEEISETLEKNRISSGNTKSSENHDQKKNVTNNNTYNGIPTIKPEEKSSDSIQASEIYELKKNPIVRNIPIKKDSEKPKVTVMPKPEFTFCKIDIEPIKHTNNNELDNEVITNNYSVDTISKSMASDEDSVSTKSDSDNDDRQFVETRNPVKKNEESLKIRVFSDNKDSDTDDKTSTDISLEDVRKVDGQSDSLQDTYEPHFQPQILDLPPIIPKIGQGVVFSVEASRESAGEPDGRADPEEMSEPPALPRSPPPQVDPRPSFLHGMFKESPICRPTVPEKPKLPVKPLSVIKQVTKRPQANVLPQQQQVIMQLHQTLNVANSKNVIPDNCPSKDENDRDIREENSKINDSNSCNIYEDSDCENLSKSPLVKQDSNCSVNLTPNKRKAPKPPPSGCAEEPCGSIYQRNPMANLKSDSPVVREKEKRERASSCSPKFRQGVNSNPAGDQALNVEKVPEPAPRRSLSLSHDNLICTDDKKKGKLKFSLRKLLRIGSSKELDKKDLQLMIDPTLMTKREEVNELTPHPKPRLVIIHPLELNGSSVEVLKSTSDISMMKHSNNDNISLSDGSTYSGSSGGDVEEPTYKELQTKPPPPPRKSSEESITVTDGCPTRPARPPPPKSALLLRQQKQLTWTTPPTRPADNVYANLGEVRSAIAPRKPERTASMREREAQLELPKKRMPSSENDSDGDLDIEPTKLEVTNKVVIENSSHNIRHNYDDVYCSTKYEEGNDNYPNNHKRNSSENDYEFVSNCSSTPQPNGMASKMCPVVPGINRVTIKSFIPTHRKSDCNIDKSSEYMKFNNTFVRSTSLQYCGNESESEIYSPYSFYSCNELTDNENSSEFNGNQSLNNTTNKLRVRKGRSIVHKNLEDNYGAVVIANHEALAQVLEQVQQSAIMQPSLRGLKTCTNLRWSDFTVTSTPLKSSGSLRVGKRVFHSAVWNSSSAGGAVNVTLMLHKEQMASQIVSQSMVQPQTLCLNAVTEFCDLVPLQQFGEEGDQLVQATIVVLARSQVDTIETFGDYLLGKNTQKCSNIEKDTTETQHEATFMMLQLINGLKCLQARGVEEVPESLSTFVICRDYQAMVNSQQNSSCNLSDSGTEDGPPSIQMPKANSYGRLCILQGLSEENNCNMPTEEKVCSLCECAVTALNLLLPNDKLTSLIRDLLNREKSISLSQVKSILEFTLWGPWDVVSGLPGKERELSLQRWLDLERATVLHGLVRTRVQLNVFEQSHLLFLVRSSSKIMCDASVLLESANIY